jgi:hypothetical protein
LVVFDDLLHVHYGQAYVFSERSDDTGDMAACFVGQANGLLGAAVRGQLFLLTGLHTGDVRFRTEIADKEPPLDPVWEECVEATFEPHGTASLVQWDRTDACALPLGGQAYRVRYHARGMDAGNTTDTILEGEDPVDEYLLVFWPAPAAPDCVIAQTSAIADYWHRWAQEL